MKFRSVSSNFFNLCSFDPEILQKDDRRPYLVVLRLTYKGIKQDFAIPFRSNIKKDIPKEQYFSLPPRPNTRAERVHGLHYIKMFPIKKQYLQKFHTYNDPYYEIIIKRIENNLIEIVQQAQVYLTGYENGSVLEMSTNIEAIYCAINGIVIDSQSEVAGGSQEVQDKIAQNITV